MNNQNTKPLGGRAYGSIGHLPNSRLGSGDHHISEGQARILCERTRDRHDCVVVEEKLDGSCVAVAKIGGEIVPLIRAGYAARESHYLQHRVFHEWATAPEQLARFDAVLSEGERVCGEWLAMAHGTLYALPHEPFVAFDVFRDGKRILRDEFWHRLAGVLVTPRVLSIGPAYSVALAQEALQTSGHGAIGGPEGAVWRVERKGRVDFLGKWVRHSKEDGSLLPSVVGGMGVWQWWPGIRLDADVERTTEVQR